MTFEAKLLRMLNAHGIKRAARALLVLTLLAAATSCKRSGIPDNQSNVALDASRAREATLRVPPFATKEPERYQATRVITSDSGTEITRSTDALNSVTFIARVGERRREDYEIAGSKVSFLQLPGGSYLLLAEKKIYAEFTGTGGSEANGRTASIPPDFSPEKLLNETRPEAHYEELGSETVDGRVTRKYRVTLRGKIGGAKETSTESLVWVDEKLGMPIRSEMSSTGGARVITELRDISETVDERLFDLPQDYRKVGEKEFFALLNGGSTRQSETIKPTP